MTDELSCLVGHPDFHRRNFRVIGYVDGFSAKMVTLFGTGNKYDIVADAESELSVIVHQCGYR